MEWDAAHEQRLAETESRSKSNTHRLDEMKRRQDNLEELITSVRVLAVRQESVESDVKEIKVDVKAMSAKSGKRWEAIVDKVILTVVTAVAAYMLARLGL